jgi:hypothetical protein
MRFNIDETLPVIHIKIPNKNRASYLLFKSYFPWYNHEIESITFEHLKVLEHHRVLHEYAKEDDVPDCDGFILEDSQKRRFFNQYPRACYGQTSDRADRMFHRDLTAYENIDEWLALSEPAYEYRLLSDYLKDLKRGIHERRKEQFKEGSTYSAEDIHHTDLLELHVKAIVDQYKSEHGKDIVFEPHLYGEGENAKWLEGWYDVKFV